ncbi:MAG: hypothetical protein KC413_17330, partial [Anaerolineales bacterium]|nr:hypothetical protein [Anaerolineales bacterium]
MNIPMITSGRLGFIVSGGRHYKYAACRLILTGKRGCENVGTAVSLPPSRKPIKTSLDHKEKEGSITLIYLTNSLTRTRPSANISFAFGPVAQLG